MPTDLYGNLQLDSNPEILRKIEQLVLPEIRNAKNFVLQSVQEGLPEGDTPYALNGCLELPGGILQFKGYLSTGNKFQFIDNGKSRNAAFHEAAAEKIVIPHDDNPRDAVKDIFKKIRRALDLEL